VGGGGGGDKGRVSISTRRSWGQGEMLVGLGKHCSWKIGFREDRKGALLNNLAMYIFPCSLSSIIYFLVCTFYAVYNIYVSVALLHLCHKVV
jgi:hypothetical protein